MKKTKPIKKIMIFTIITVMIASLFAVPAFADVQWDAVSGNLTPITLNPMSLADSVYTEGYYCISVDVDDIKSAVFSMSEFGTDFAFHIFGFVANNLALYNNGYVRIYHFDGGWTDYRNYFDNGNDSYYTAIGYDTDLEQVVIKCPEARGYYQWKMDDLLKIDIIIPEYPVLNALGNSQADAFWNNVVYSVYQYSNATPDPEEPTDPTPPADGAGQGIFEVWREITTWIINGLAQVSNAFYLNGKLTLLGYLCIIPLGIGVALLLISIVQKFLHLRG